jgi:hypothetical protein
VRYIPAGPVFLQHFTKRPQITPDLAACLPARFPPAVWAAAASFFVCAYVFLFAVVHPYVDTRICLAQLPDPLFAYIPYDGRWYRISHELFYLVTAAALTGLVTQAARGEQRPLLRFGVGVGFQALFRSLTMSLLPLCKATVAPGHRALEHVPTFSIGPLTVPWRAWATNDLVFSGHVAEFLILFFAVRTTWPRTALAGLVVFQVLQAVALIATRGHYTVDLVIAVPFALLADRLGVWLLGRSAPLRHHLPSR